MNRSEELSKLLGIPAKYYAYKWDYDPEDRSDTIICQLFDNYGDALKYNTNSDKPVEKTFPDFEQDSNFVRLLEGCFKFPMEFLSKETYKESVLSTVEAFLKDDSDYEHKDELKTELAAVAWEY